MAESPFERLTDKQKRFVVAYVGEANCCGAEAARLAGYNGRSRQAAWDLLNGRTKQDIRAAIDEKLREQAIGSEEILARLSVQARGNIKMVLTEDGELPEKLDALSWEQAAVIKKFSVRKSKGGTTVTVELHDSQAALLALARRWGLMPELLKIQQELSQLSDEDVLRELYGPLEAVAEDDGREPPLGIPPGMG
jgi:phage terminase small subunit